MLGQQRGTRSVRRFLIVAAVLLVVPSALNPAGAATATGFRVPAGYRTAAWTRLAGGVDQVAFRRDGAVNAQAIQVARIDPASGYGLRAVVSDQRLSGGLEKTSAMCRRMKCLAGINGDFFVTNGQPVGGLAILGQAIRSPNQLRPQLLIGGERKVSIGNETWRGQITLSDLRSLTLDGVNVPLRGGKISLFTAAWGKSTGNRKGVTELAVQIVEPKGPLVLGRESTIRFLSTRHVGDAPIPGSGLILAGEGAGGRALDALWSDLQRQRVDRQAAIQVHSNSRGTESIGGAPVLLRDGRRAFTIVPRGLVQGRHPRTVVGWNRRGEIFLVTIDGRQPGYADGMTLVEASDVMLRMGATDAINLDGGGSTTFVSRGRVINRPSDVIVEKDRRRVAARVAAPGERIVGRVERAVSTAIVVVPIPKAALKPVARPKKPAVRPSFGTRFLPVADDPVSGRFAASPARLPEGPRRAPVIAFALVLLVGTASSIGRVSQRR